MKGSRLFESGAFENHSPKRNLGLSKGHSGAQILASFHEIASEVFEDHWYIPTQVSLLQAKYTVFPQSFLTGHF